MKPRALPFFAAALAGVIGLAACHRHPAAASDGTPAAEASPAEIAASPQVSSRLRAAVDAYKQTQNPENDAAVRQAMAEVTTEIDTLQDLVAKRHGRDRQKVAAKLRRLEAYLSEETTRFAEIQAAHSLPDTPGAPAIPGKVDNSSTPADAASPVTSK